MKRHHAVTMLAMPALLLAGCGTRLSDEQLAARRVLGAQTVAGSSGQLAAAGAPVESNGATATQASPVQGGPQTGDAVARAVPASVAAAAPAAPFTEHSDGMTIQITPSCVPAPGTATVVFKTVPLADIAFAAAFADGDARGQYGVSMTDAGGRFVWNLVVPDGTVPGEARIVAGARNHKVGEGSASRIFRVAEQGAC